MQDIHPENTLSSTHTITYYAFICKRYHPTTSTRADTHAHKTCAHANEGAREQSGSASKQDFTVHHGTRPSRYVYLGAQIRV